MGYYEPDGPLMKNENFFYTDQIERRRESKRRTHREEPGSLLSEWRATRAEKEATEEKVKTAASAGIDGHPRFRPRLYYLMTINLNDILTRSRYHYSNRRTGEGERRALKTSTSPFT